MPSPEAGSPPDEHRSPQGFRQVGEDVRLRGWRISIVEASFEAPDGTTFTRDVVRHPGAVAVVPVTEKETVLLVRQYRGSVDRELLEIPAGTRDVEGESAEETALRELSEEVGVRAGHLELLATVYNSPGFCDEDTCVFLATDLVQGVPTRDGVEERFMEVQEIALADVDEMIASGTLNDAQTVIGLVLARDRLRTRAAAHGGG